MDKWYKREQKVLDRRMKSKNKTGGNRKLRRRGISSRRRTAKRN